ncbi:MAG: hypothetical protein ACXW5U_32370 [Thermoanaerobaculia bacterium]
MKKKCAFLVLIVTLATATPVFAAPRDRDRDFGTAILERVTRVVKRAIRTLSTIPTPPIPPPAP